MVGYLVHHGIKGQKWGVRRYVNPDGTLTPEGERRYGTYERFQEIDRERRANKAKSQERLRNASISRGKTLYDSGYKHSRNVMKTLGKATIKSIAYGTASGIARELGAKHISRILVAGGIASVGSTLVSGARKAADYERYSSYENPYQNDKKRR